MRDDNTDKNKSVQAAQGYMNPYVAGLLLGLTLLASFLVLGAGLGASGGIARVSAFCESCLVPVHALSSEYFGDYGQTPLRHYLVFMLLGVFAGGLLSAFAANRISFQVERGKACSRPKRMWLAFIGGILAGFASRLGQGCTSGQALSGAALLLTGSIIFMLCIFMGGYAAAYFVRRQWHD